MLGEPGTAGLGDDAILVVGGEQRRICGIKPGNAGPFEAGLAGSLVDLKLVHPAPWRHRDPVQQRDGRGLPCGRPPARKLQPVR